MIIGYTIRIVMNSCLVIPRITELKKYNVKEVYNGRL